MRVIPPTSRTIADVSFCGYEDGGVLTNGHHRERVPAHPPVRLLPSEVGSEAEERAVCRYLDRGDDTSLVETHSGGFDLRKGRSSKNIAMYILPLSAHHVI